MQGGCWKAAYLPSMEVQGSEFAKVGVRHVNVEALRLVDESAPICCHVDQLALLYLPHRLVQSLQVLGNIQLLQLTASLSSW